MRVGMVSAEHGPVLAVERDGHWHTWIPPERPTASGNWSALDALSLGEAVHTNDALDPQRLLPPILPPRNVICLGKTTPRTPRSSRHTPERPSAFRKRQSSSPSPRARCVALVMSSLSTRESRRRLTMKSNLAC